mgnify:FL=1
MEHSAGRYVCGEIETENCSIMVKRPAMQASISLLGITGILEFLSGSSMFCNFRAWMPGKGRPAPGWRIEADCTFVIDLRRTA